MKIENIGKSIKLKEELDYTEKQLESLRNFNHADLVHLSSAGYDVRVPGGIVLLVSELVESYLIGQIGEIKKKIEEL